MPFTPALCPACQHELPLDFINRPAPDPCPGCRRKIQSGLFPAFFRKPDARLLDAKKKDGEASCFYHPGKPAVAVCDFCGVFLSDLCDLQINGKHICPPCFAKPENKNALLQSDRSRTLYDGIALALAVFGLLLISLSFITSLAAIFIAIRYWKSPGSVIPRSRLRLVLAIVFASLQLLAWVGFIVALIFAANSE